MTSSPCIDRDRHTLSSYLDLYRRGKIGPLRYAGNRVPIIACRNCGRLRPDSGTRCGFCGAYQRCAYEAAVAASPLPACSPIAGDAVSGEGPRQAGRPPKKRPNKPINPRRNKHHV